MQIDIKVSREELAEMQVTEEDLIDRVIEQLDDAVPPGGERGVSFSSYNVNVQVIS